MTMASSRLTWSLLLGLGLAACGGGGSREQAAEEGPAARLAGDAEAAVAEAPPATEPSEPAGGRGGAAAGEHLRGQVFITGSAPMTFVTLRAEDGSSVNLSGELEAELRRLSGARVEVRGARQGQGRMARFNVDGYDVVEINGERPVVGVLRERDGAFWIGEGDESVSLSGVPDALQRQSGAKVWVTGPRTAGSLRVQSYGVIREQ